MWITFSIAAVRSVVPRDEVHFMYVAVCLDQPSFHLEWLDGRRQYRR
jgi:hypothetical protein